MEGTSCNHVEWVIGIVDKTELHPKHVFGFANWPAHIILVERFLAVYPLFGEYYQHVGVHF